MIRNRFETNNQQPQQQQQPQRAYTGSNQATAGGGAGYGPNVDLSHLTAEERAMIQSVMAKAEMAGNELGANPSMPNTTINYPPQASQMMNLQQQQQQPLGAMQFAGAPSQLNMGRIQQPQRPPFQQGQVNPNNMQPQQLAQAGQAMGFNGQPNQFNPMGANLGVGMNRAPMLNPALQNPQQPAQINAFQQHPQQAGNPYLAQNAVGQQQQPDSSRSQLPLLEQRTQQLVSQINSQFNLGGASASNNRPNNTSLPQQRPMGPSQLPSTNNNSSLLTTTSSANQMNQLQPLNNLQQQQQQSSFNPNSMQPQALTSQVPNQNYQLATGMQPNCFQANVSGPLGPQVAATSQAALMPSVFGAQNQQIFPSQNNVNQNPAFRQQLQQPNQATLLPSQTLPFNGQFVASDAQAMVQHQQPNQQHFGFNPQFGGFGCNETGFMLGQPRFGTPLDERQHIKFKHEMGRGGALSDQDDYDEVERRNRASRRPRAARLSQFKSADMADELDRHDEERWSKRRQLREFQARGELKRTPIRRLPKPGQQVQLQRPIKNVVRAAPATQQQQLQRSRQPVGHTGSASSSSSELLPGEELSSLSSGSEQVATKSTTGNKHHDNRARERDSPNVTKKTDEVTSNLMSELKLNEQTSQVMEQQQQLIKQSQELIKLQQAQLEQQAKKATVAEEKTDDQPEKAASKQQATEETITRSDRKSPQVVTRQATLDESSKQTKERRSLKNNRSASMGPRDHLYANSSGGDSDQPDDCGEPIQTGGRGVVKTSQRQSTSTPSRNSKCSTRWLEQESPLLDSPTSTTDSDLERLTCSASLARARHSKRRITPTTERENRKLAPRHHRNITGLTPSPLPVVAAIQLHQLQSLHHHHKDRHQEANTSRARGQTRTRADLMRTRSVCNSPQGLGGGQSRTRPSSPDIMSEFSQRKMLPDPPTNAVPLTPSMVRKMVQTQRVAATSSGKLLTSVNAQSTLLSNTHSLRQPCLDQNPSAPSAGHNISMVDYDTRSPKLAPRPIGSYTAKISGAQVSFAPEQSATTATRHQNLSALSRADLSKFLDFTYGTSILKATSNYQPVQLGRLYARDGNGWSRGQLTDDRCFNSLSQRLQDTSSRGAYYDSEPSGRSHLGSWRRNSEGEGDHLTYRPSATSSSKHVNFDYSNSGHLNSSGQSRQRHYLGTLPKSNQASQWPSTSYSPLDNYSARVSDRYSARDNLRDALDATRSSRFSSYRPSWASRQDWPTNASDDAYSGRLASMAGRTSRDYAPRAVSQYRDRYLGNDGSSLSGRWDTSTRYPYRQRSFDTS